MEPILKVQDLHTEITTNYGTFEAVSGVSFELGKGETLGLVGESGCGKSLTSLSITGLLGPKVRVAAGEAIFEGRDIFKLSPKEMRQLRGGKISMIFQEPMTALNPLFTVGNQMVEMMLPHMKITKKEALKRSVELLTDMGIERPEQVVKSYPFELSGGMLQRVMIAMSLSCNPKILIADEPTTALDVTIQAQVLSLMKELNERLGTATILITHNLGCASSICDKIIVMYGGKVMEEGTTEEIFYEPRHPYTMGLLNSIPKVTGEESKQRLIPILGTPPDMLNPPTGCPFYPRCQFAMKACASMQVPEQYLSETHRVSCFMCHPQAPSNPMYEAQKGGIRRDQ